MKDLPNVNQPSARKRAPTTKVSSGSVFPAAISVLPWSRMPIRLGVRRAGLRASAFQSIGNGAEFAMLIAQCAEIPACKRSTISAVARAHGLAAPSGAVMREHRI